MATGSVSLQNFLYFPPFGMLPAADELDTNYYAENSQGESGDACMLHCSGSVKKVPLCQNRQDPLENANSQLITH